jgi:hypothetical protein
MGTGVRTYVTATSPYLLAAFLLLASPGLAATLAAGVGFGVGRGIVPGLRSFAPDPRDWDDALDHWSRSLVRMSGVMAGTVVVVLAMQVT